MSGNSLAKSTEYLLRSVFLFWMVGPLSCRSFHKRDQERPGILQSIQEIFRTFLSSINIEHCPKYIKKLALITVHITLRPFESFTKGFLRRDLSPGLENLIFQI